MKRLFRPSALLLASAVLALAAAAWLLTSARGDTRPQPRPVADGEHEIAWLYAATNASAWERFVAAVRLSHERGGFRGTVDESNAFPLQSTAVPELAVTVEGASGRLVFRWYKLTSDWKIADWVQALFARPRPPLAVIGGSSSDLAIELAERMASEDKARSLGANAPLLLITNATALKVNQGYPGRTFRFCFNNPRIAEAVTDFIWSQDDLRPDMEPHYFTRWDDDPYSTDLTASFYETLYLPGRAPNGGVPLGNNGLPTPQRIYSSVGTFDRPNRFEAEAAQFLLDELDKQPSQKRPLLVLPGQTNPTRRFLRALVRTAPGDARRFVVACGDAIAFNTIYRDRNVAWPIQDLPFTLVLFCHRNPVDHDAGFLPSPTGTEDLRLYEDIATALIEAAFLGRSEGEAGNLLDTADELRDRFARATRQAGRINFHGEGEPLFDDRGDRRPATGEHIVVLRPHVTDFGRVLPEAAIEVWHLPATADGPRNWQRHELLRVPYEGSLPNNDLP